MRRLLPRIKILKRKKLGKNLYGKAKRKRKTIKNEWHIAGGKALAAPRGFGILGILNLTPDSFFDGGKYENLEHVLRKTEEMLAEDSDIIDVGAESTRPGAHPVKPGEECARLFPALGEIRKRFPEAVISVDTRNSETARQALEAGCQIINDVSACRHDSALLEVLCQYKPGYVLMHAQGTPDRMQKGPFYGNVVESVRNFFEVSLNRLTAAGLPENRIALDPGIGFGKSFAHNLQLLKRIEEFTEFGRPLLAGISMKSTLVKICGSAQAAGEATAVASSLLFSKGVSWHRVHEPGRVGRALSVAQALM